MGPQADSAARLVASLGLVQATAMVAGTIIGASIFVQPSEITRHVPTVAGIFLVWTVAGILTFFGALASAELASAFAETGGVYVFLKRIYSPLVGFLWGWAMFWSMHSGIIAAIAVIFARYTGYYVPLDDAGVRLVAIGAIAVLSAINYVGVAHGSRVQTAFTIAKVAAIAAIVVLVAALAPTRASGRTDPTPQIGTLTFDGFVQALVAALFAFGGWHMVTYTAGETRDPHRTIPRALLVGTILVTICYVALNAAYLVVLPLEVVVSSTRVAADAADALLGKGGAAVMSGLVMFSTFGALSGIVLAGPRVYFSMAHDGLLFRWVGQVHPRFRTPHRAIVLQAVWASLLVATGTYRGLFTRVIYTEWLFFAAMTLGLFLLRRRPDYTPAYPIWGYPLVPLVFVLSSLLIVGQRLWADPRESLLGLLMVAAGIPVYYAWTARRSSHRSATS
jgi:APA family basic amino acid/polyamine antiporter